MSPGVASMSAIITRNGLRSLASAVVVARCTVPQLRRRARSPGVSGIVPVDRVEKVLAGVPRSRPLRPRGPGGSAAAEPLRGKRRPALVVPENLDEIA